MKLIVNVVGVTPELLCVWSDLDADALEKFDHPLARRLGWFIAAFAANELSDFESQGSTRGDLQVLVLSDRPRLRNDMPGKVRVVGVAYVQDNADSDTAFDTAAAVRERFMRARDTLEALLPAIVAGGNLLIGVGLAADAMADPWANDVNPIDKPIPYRIVGEDKPASRAELDWTNAELASALRRISALERRM